MSTEINNKLIFFNFNFKYTFIYYRIYKLIIKSLLLPSIT